MKKLTEELPQDQPVVMVVGAVAKGNPTMEVDYINDKAYLLMHTYEEIYDIL